MNRLLSLFPIFLNDILLLYLLFAGHTGHFIKADGRKASARTDLRHARQPIRLIAL